MRANESVDHLLDMIISYAKAIHAIACRATRDPAAPIAISQYDPIFASPVGNFTPWQIHISPAGATSLLITAVVPIVALLEGVHPFQHCWPHHQVTLQVLKPVEFGRWIDKAAKLQHQVIAPRDSTTL